MYFCNCLRPFSIEWAWKHSWCPNVISFQGYSRLPRIRMEKSCFPYPLGSKCTRVPLNTVTILEHVQAEAAACVQLRLFDIISSDAVSPWTQSLSFRLLTLLRASWTYLSPCTPSPPKAGITDIHLAQLSYGCWGTHSSPYACTVRTWPTVPFLQPHISVHTMLCSFGEARHVETGSHCLVLADLELTDMTISLCVLVRVTISMMKHHDQKQVGEEKALFGLYFCITVSHKQAQQPRPLKEILASLLHPHLLVGLRS